MIIKFVHLLPGSKFLTFFGGEGITFARIIPLERHFAIRYSKSCGIFWCTIHDIPWNVRGGCTYLLRHLGQWRGRGNATTACFETKRCRVSNKRQQIALDGYSRWLVCFYPRSKFDSVMRVQKSNFRESGIFQPHNPCLKNAWTAASEMETTSTGPEETLNFTRSSRSKFKKVRHQFSTYSSVS